MYIIVVVSLKSSCNRIQCVGQSDDEESGQSDEEPRQTDDDEEEDGKTPCIKKLKVETICNYIY